MESIKSLKQVNILKYFLIILISSTLLAISAKLKIPFYPVPMTMQTFVVLLIGVCFGWLFGDYTYGDSLGFKLDGVPIIMGANWLLLCLVSRDLVGKLFSNNFLIIMTSSLLMVLIDVVMEPLSNQLDFWSWKNDIIPFSNYVDWFLVAILNQTIFTYLDYKSNMFSWSLGYITILILFFFSFYI